MDQSLRIIAADDEPLILANLQEMLSALGHDVVASVGTGSELVEQCQALRPDLIVTDIKMPEMDGLEAAQQLRGDERPVPFIIVSAHHDPEFVQRALENYVLSYLVKPIQEHELRIAIRLVMQRYREFQALKEQAESLQQALQERKLVERAKGILMKRGG